MKPAQDQEYVGSVVLILLGEDLDPDLVSVELDLTPSMMWRKGEKKSVERSDGTRHVFGTHHEWSGWKLFVPPEHKRSPIEAQLAFWVELLRPRIGTIRHLKSKGFECVLDVFVTSKETASIVIPARLQRAVASLGLDMHLSFWTATESERGAAGDAASRAAERCRSADSEAS